MPTTIGVLGRTESLEGWDQWPWIGRLGYFLSRPIRQKGSSVSSAVLAIHEDGEEASFDFIKVLEYLEYQQQGGFLHEGSRYFQGWAIHRWSSMEAERA